jgi:RimJ/RimL family protein N-acetyltransferase
MDTQLKRQEFEEHWTTYLKLLQEIAFDELDMHKIYTYANDLRPKLYPVLAANGFEKEATLKEHCLFNGKFIDVLNNPRW